jgi:hypothetical protein
LQRLTPEYKDRCLQVIDCLTTRGSTNISAAIGLAAQEMHAIEFPNPVRSILLLTDGLANVGIQDSKGLVELVQNSLNFSSKATGVVPSATVPVTSASFPPSQLELDTKIPISLHAFGYGEDHDADLLESISIATEGGTYYYIEADKNVAEAFGDAIGGVVSVVAQNAVVNVQIPLEATAMGVKINKVHHDNVIKRENGSYSVTLGDLYAEESRDIVLSVQLAVPNTKGTDNTEKAPLKIPHVKASVSYTNTRERCPVTSAWTTAYIARPLGSAAVSEENTHVAAQWLRVFGVERVQEAYEFAASNNYDMARTTLTDYQAMYNTASPAVRAHKESASVFALTTTTMQDMARGHAAYMSKGAKLTKQTLMSHRYQRSTPRTNDAYQTKMKSATRKAFMK